MANGIILGPDLTQATYYTVAWSADVGLWLPDYPLSNLATDRRAEEAWSLDASEDATQFVVDLGAQRSVKGVALPWHNLSGDATVSMYLYTDAARTDLAWSVEDSLVYREVYPLDAVLWEDEELWDGKMTAERREIFPVPWFELAETAAIGRYLHGRISDTGNDDGRVKLGRLVVAPGFQPRVNFAWGSSISIEDESIRTTSLGGADYWDVRDQRRTMMFDYKLARADEAMANFLDQVYELGRSRQCFVAWDPDDTVHRHRRSFLATIEQADPLVAVGYGLFGTARQFREVIA